MLRHFIITFCIVVSIIILFSVIITQKRDERRTLETKQKVLAQKADKLKKKNTKLKKEYDALINDPIQIEREAREKFGYIKPGEVTYKKYRFSISELKEEETKQTSLLSKLDSFLFDGPFPWQVPMGLIIIAAIFLLITYKYEHKGLRPYE